MARAKKYPVIADFTDIETGKTVKAGTQFEVDAKRAQKLFIAGVIEDPGSSANEPDGEE